MSEGRGQNSQNTKPQNIEQGISNDEVFFSFDIQHSVFDIQNRGSILVADLLFLAKP